MRVRTRRLRALKPEIIAAGRHLAVQVIEADVTTTDLETTIDLGARATRGEIKEVATKTDQIGDTVTATATKLSPIEEMETEMVMNAGKGIDQNRRRALGGSDTKKSVGMRTKIETITGEEAPTEATGIALPRLVEEITTATSLLLRRLKSPRRSQQRQIPRNRQPGHPRHLLPVAKR